MVLKEYVKIVLDFEKEIFAQEQIIKQLKREIANLGKKLNFSEPIPPVEETYEKTKKINLSTFIFLVFALFNIAGAITLFFEHEAVSGFVFLSIGIIPLIISVTSLNKVNSQIKERNHKKYRKYIENLENYYTKKKEYEKNIFNQEQRLKYEKIRKEFLQNELNSITKMHTLSKKNLTAIYKKNIIFPKYRNLAMISMIYEYLISGRCKALQGHEGAYNILENEIRLEKIITELDTISKQLNSIKYSQTVLYNAIQESNLCATKIINNTGKISKDIQKLVDNESSMNSLLTKLSENSAINTYNSNRIRKEIEYLNSIK